MRYEERVINQGSSKWKGGEGEGMMYKLLAHLYIL